MILTDVKFVLLSSIGTVVDIGLLYILTKKNKPKKISNFISYIVGVLLAFFLCRSFVFTNAKDYMGGRLLVDLLVHLIGLVVQQWLLDFLLQKGWSLGWSKFITVLENAVLMFLLTKYIVFLEL